MMNSSLSHTDCTWSGVTCTEDRKKVLGLNLTTNGVTGQLPDEFFQKLKDLEGKCSMLKELYNAGFRAISSSLSSLLLI